MYKSIFVNTTGANDWILQRIADEICNCAIGLGYVCHKGSLSDYKDEEVCYNIWWRTAVPLQRAKVNSVFITHTDDISKEMDLIKMKSQFDSYICMSPEDAIFLCELGYDSKKVFGFVLPPRNDYIRPFSIGIFSACYSDGRKNEKWLLDFCKSHIDATLLNFVFIGKGWYKVVDELESLGVSYEWHNVSRKLPYEYRFQQDKLNTLDYYLYMGMDGGAMGTYDAYAMGVALMVSNDGYHRSIPNIQYSFDNERTFITQMEKIVRFSKDRLAFFENNNYNKYVKNLIKCWEGENFLVAPICGNETSYRSVLEKREENYFPMTTHRLRQAFSSIIRRLLAKWMFR